MTDFKIPILKLSADSLESLTSSFTNAEGIDLLKMVEALHWRYHVEIEKAKRSISYSDHVKKHKELAAKAKELSAILQEFDEYDFVRLKMQHRPLLPQYSEAQKNKRRYSNILNLEEISDDLAVLHSIAEAEVNDLKQYKPKRRKKNIGLHAIGRPLLTMWDKYNHEKYAPWFDDSKDFEPRNAKAKFLCGILSAIDPDLQNVTISNFYKALPKNEDNVPTMHRTLFIFDKDSD